jgi:hypothetical protein
MPSRPARRSARDRALLYASLGSRCFPLEPNGKRPLRGGWQADPTSDPDRVARTWRREPEPESNIGVIRGQALDAMDVEPPGRPCRWASAGPSAPAKNSCHPCGSAIPARARV